VLRKYPALRSTLFELPGARAVARQRLSQEPEKARIEIVEGDVFKAPLPQGRDALLIANTSMSCRQRTTATHSQPLTAALMSGQFLIMAGEGQRYSEQEAH
jgi:hypothetical protein